MRAGQIVMTVILVSSATSALGADIPAEGLIEFELHVDLAEHRDHSRSRWQ